MGPQWTLGQPSGGAASRALAGPGEPSSSGSGGEEGPPGEKEKKRERNKNRTMMIDDDAIEPVSSDRSTPVRCGVAILLDQSCVRWWENEAVQSGAVPAVDITIDPTMIYRTVYLSQSVSQ
ncbi:hypothetical protein H113_04558 [Trichophyton rubrum MR1459]|nr:hypothetical protein H113_04558 [Trichophyton rubrum MR1459]